jgi:hypothetical protein
MTTIAKNLRALMTSKHQNWGTPDDYFARLHEVCRFTTDGCAAAGDAKLPHFIEADGLNYSWRGLRVFSNPEYRFCNLWVPKARDSALNLPCMSASLVPYRPETHWWSIGALSEDGEAGKLRSSFYDEKNRVLWLRWAHLITGIHSVPTRLGFNPPKDFKPKPGSKAAANAPFPSAVIFHFHLGTRPPVRRWLIERCPK